MLLERFGIVIMTLSNGYLIFVKKCIPVILFHESSSFREAQSYPVIQVS